jgi:hypothetical protein
MESKLSVEFCRKRKSLFSQIQKLLTQVFFGIVIAQLEESLDKLMVCRKLEIYIKRGVLCMKLTFKSPTSAL